MLRKLYGLALVLVIVAAALYVVLLNREAVVLNLGDGATITSPLGVLILAALALGMVCTSIVASWFGFKAYLRERSLKQSERRREQIRADVVRARNLKALGQTEEAKVLWEQLARRYPNEVEIRLGLAEILESQGQTQEALRIVDAARAEWPHDASVLLKSYELNSKLGNKTAARDSLALILANNNSPKVAILARNISLELGMLEDALEYNNQYLRLGGDRQVAMETEAAVRFSILERDCAGLAANQLHSRLSDFLRSYRSYAPALAAIAKVEASLGNDEAASQAWIRAASLVPNPLQYWQQAVDFWIVRKQPDKALAVARLATREAARDRKVDSDLLLSHAYIRLGMHGDAEQQLRSLALDSLTPAHKVKALVLLGLCLERLGKERESAHLWEELSNDGLLLCEPPKPNEPSPASLTSTVGSVT